MQKTITHCSYEHKEDTSLVAEEKFLVSPPKTADEIFLVLLESVEKIDFQTLAFEATYFVGNDEPQKSVKNAKSAKNEQSLKGNSFTLTKNHYIIICVEELIAIAQRNNWGLCKNNGTIYLFNGACWTPIDRERFEYFLGSVALKMGVEKFKGKIHTFKSELYKQFMADAFIQTPNRIKDKVLINLQNGTFEITPTYKYLRNFDQKDFLTHQLSFAYEAAAKAPKFQKYLDHVLPDRDKQKVLAEYIGYIFINPSYLKFEKVLLLFGTGANGKSVFFEIIYALLGSENICNFSLQNLTDTNGYYRAQLRGKLLNYVSELTTNFDTSLFKQLVSGEPIETRLPYKEPVVITDYAKLMFNCNELPRQIELTNAFFRRFLIVHFDVTIPEDQQDKELSKKIIADELSGVFNWILDGLDRLLLQKNFSKCAAIDNARSDYEKQSDSLQLFISTNGFKASIKETVLISVLYSEYMNFCSEEGCNFLGKSKFIARLKYLQFNVKRLNVGNVVYMSNEI